MRDKLKSLVNEIGDYWHYTNEDKREIWDSFKLNPEGVIKALKQQVEHVRVLIQLGKKYEVIK